MFLSPPPPCPLAGEFTVVNQHLLHDLTRMGLWDADMKNELVAANGSVAVSGASWWVERLLLWRCVVMVV